MSIIPEKIENAAAKAQEASLKTANLPESVRNKALENIENILNSRKDEILKQNALDREEAEKNGISKTLLKRLILNDDKLHDIAENVKGVRELGDPIGKTLAALELDTGLELYQVTSPLGVIGMVFESRPDALVQIASLCIKSGNAVIMKGGSEALHSNRILHSLIVEAASSASPCFSDAIVLLETREEVDIILKLDKYISLLIPRGSNAFVEHVKNNTKIPVLGHSDGICHVYIDKDAEAKMAVEVSFDAKCQYPAVCNAMETLLVHKDAAERILPETIEKLKEAGVEIRGCAETVKIIPGIKTATEEDWKTEYNDLILSVKIVSSIEEAIEHINKYGSHHTDAIITGNEESADRFLREVDSSSVLHNASTRFSDGYRYGKGAEVGISTNKIHARGPVGVEGLVIYKYILMGNGQIVRDYSGSNAKPFTHRKLDKDWR